MWRVAAFIHISAEVHCLYLVFTTVIDDEVGYVTPRLVRPRHRLNISFGTF